MLNDRRAILVPGAANALSARVIEDLGFPAVYLTGAGITNTFLGAPDLGLISLPELVEHTAAVRDAVQLPILVDADTGFGNAVNVYHTLRRLERAGANAVQLEDQVSPKKCGHFTGKEVIPMDVMAGKIKAAADARSSRDVLIIARTDARAVKGFEDAVERAARYIEAGADVTFVEAPETLEEVSRIPRLLPAPQVINMVVGGKTPLLSQSELESLGYGMTLYANAALQGAVAGMMRALSTLLREGRLEEKSELVASFKERQRLVNKPFFDALDKKYSEK